MQDFEQWGARDYGRPSRDAVRGMLPPKLARMMVNLEPWRTVNTHALGSVLWRGDDPIGGGGD